MSSTNQSENAIHVVNVFGFKVFSDKLDRIPLNNITCQTINTISPNSYGMSIGDNVFREALKQTDYLVLDGVYFALSSFFLQGKTIRKNQGPDVFSFFMNLMNTRNGRVFFLGSTNTILEKIRQKAAIDYPNITIGFFSPPYKAIFDDEDDNEMVNAINAFSPDIVFVGMTAPKQEKWVHKNKYRLHAKLAVSIGAVFDWYAGNEKPIAPIWWKLRLGWLVRTVQRPEILKRYPNIFIFFRHLVMAILGSKKYKYGNF